MNARLLATAVAGLFLVGCSETNDDGAQTSPPPPPEEVDELLVEIERTRPGVVLGDFVRAAARQDERRMWERLSTPTRRRVGPVLSAFRRGGAARALEHELASLGRRHDLILSETITPVFAVAAVGRGSRVYAAALRLEGGLWRVELDSPVRIKPLRPKPGETVVRRTQLAAEVAAGTQLVEAGLWLDGLAFPSRGGGASSNTLTMFGETSALRRGPHYVVAFASTAANASAHAWAFRVR